MNDIASASDKGRRTIYTYFKSKTEIFNAVVNREAALIVDRLAELPDLPLPPEEKLMNFVFMRFEAVKEVVSRNGSLKASFFLDVRRVDRIRRVNAPKEIIILKQILNHFLLWVEWLQAHRQGCRDTLDGYAGPRRALYKKQL